MADAQSIMLDISCSNFTESTFYIPALISPGLILSITYTNSRHCRTQMCSPAEKPWRCSCKLGFTEPGERQV